MTKYWAKQRQINEPYQGTLSSYAYILMVIHFLQQRNPPILPCLQRMTEPGVDPEPVYVDGYDCYYYNNINNLQEFGKANQESLGELLAGFFEFYSTKFDWDNSVISVRTGRFLTKEEKQWIPGKSDQNCFCTIEDPFEITHNLGRVVDEENLKFIQYEFARAHKILSSGEQLGIVCQPYTYEEDEGNK